MLIGLSGAENEPLTSDQEWGSMSQKVRCCWPTLYTASPTPPKQEILKPLNICRFGRHYDLADAAR